MYSIFEILDENRQPRERIFKFQYSEKDSPSHVNNQLPFPLLRNHLNNIHFQLEKQPSKLFRK